jgi:hypothetical protein
MKVSVLLFVACSAYAVLPLAITMGLEFPNPSRSYDPENKRIRFTGHDGMFEIVFSIEVDALSKNTFAASEAEAGYLKAFDAASRFVREMARTAYERTKRDILTPSPPRT